MEHGNEVHKKDQYAYLFKYYVYLKGGERLGRAGREKGI